MTIELRCLHRKQWTVCPECSRVGEPVGHMLGGYPDHVVVRVAGRHMVLDRETGQWLRSLQPPIRSYDMGETRIFIERAKDTPRPPTRPFGESGVREPFPPHPPVKSGSIGLELPAEYQW